MEINELLSLLEAKLIQKREAIYQMEIALTESKNEVSIQLHQLETIVRNHYPLLKDINLKKE